MLKNKGDFNVSTDLKNRIDEYKLAWNSHDVNKIVSFFVDDGIYEDVAARIVKKGKRELTAYFDAMFVDYPDFKMEVKSSFGSDEWMCFEIISSGTHIHSTLTKSATPATGKHFSVRAASIFQFRNGKIGRQSEYYNMMTLLEQVGLIPGQPK